MVELGPVAFAFLSVFAFIGFVSFITLVVAGLIAAFKK